MTEADRPVAAGTIAVVPPRYGPGVVGGAEAVLAEAARGLAERGHPVEVLTTCARDHVTWANEFPAGVEDDDGLIVRRFATETDTDGRTRSRVGDQILAGDRIPIEQQQRWLNDSLRCSGLWNHVFDHGDRYRTLIFAPYMFWTTYAVSQIHPGRSIVMPCLHDEPPAKLEVFQSMIEGAGGVWFLTDPERDLARRLYNPPARRATVGASVDVPEDYDPSRFRSEHGIDGPYVYFAGRREWGKGWDDLLSGFERYVQQRRTGVPLTLVTSGVGPVEPGPALTGHVIDVGLVSARQRDDAMAGAAAYIQPSAMESFSKTVLEAMAAGTPVIANGLGEVVSWHLDRSGGGLRYRGAAELVECLNFVTDRPEAARELAAGGPAYVDGTYRIDQVIDRMEDSLDSWFPKIDVHGHKGHSKTDAETGDESSGVAPFGVEPSVDDKRSRRTLLVSPFAPYRDGIATYAAQELQSLRRDGEHVDVVSPLPSAARWHLPLGGPRGMLSLAKLASKYDKTVIQFGPELLFGRCRHPAERVAVWGSLAAVAATTELDVRFHEVEYGPLERNPVERRAASLALSRAARLTVHTEAERARLEELLAIGDRVEMIDHGQHFVPVVLRPAAEARAALGLPVERFLFVSIGFLQQHKGFDRAIDAIADLGVPDAELHVVGSARVDHPEILEYVGRLERRAGAVPSASLHRRFVSDEEFDLWLQAADAVVLPYREIWSSGVLERARLFGIPILASDLPQLHDQAPPGTLFFGDTAELTRAMEKACASSGYHPRPVGHSIDEGSAGDPTDDGWDLDGEIDQRAVEQQVVARARLGQRASTVPAGRSALDRSSSDTLRQLSDLHTPTPTSARPGVAPVKRLVERLIDWRIEPVARQVRELQRATQEAVAGIETDPSSDGSDERGR